MKDSNLLKYNKKELKSKYINENGVRKIIIKSKKAEVIQIAKQLNIEKIETVEQKTIGRILEVFQNENMTSQKRCFFYYIDLYFEDYKIAIECDENAHNDRNKNYENIRQEFIEERLNCKFIRYNPDVKDFDISNVIEQIRNEIKLRENFKNIKENNVDPVVDFINNRLIKTGNEKDKIKSSELFNTFLIFLGNNNINNQWFAKNMDINNIARKKSKDGNYFTGIKYK